MFYRESGDFSETYPADSQTFPIKFDRYRYYAVLAVAFLVIPFIINDYWANAILVPFLIYAIAAIGLNILVGYCGQVSLGTGGFMAVGAYACYKLMTAFPDVSIMIHVLISGGITAAVVTVFGLPSLRIKGFYLAVATLAAQFFLGLVVQPGRMVLQLLCLRSDQRAGSHGVLDIGDGPEYGGVGKIYDLPGVSHLCGHHCAQLDPWILGPKMVGHSRYGYCR